MTIKIIKRSSKRVFLLYAVIWGLCVLVFISGPSFLLAEEESSPPIEQVIRSLSDPFDVQMRAPEVVELFLAGLAEIKKQKEIQERPPEEKVVEPVMPTVIGPAPVVVPKEPVKPQKSQIPSMKITGIIYDTDRPQAIINGTVVGVGSKISGASVLSIEKGRVVMRYEGIDITLKLNNE
jgi:hypothetical protein